ncbi:MAG: hypothetical protein JWN46_1192 [Acidimicrobiales bacterium]|nr:hypothetical protein [Acidimicrobiales bacterium]
MYLFVRSTRLAPGDPQEGVAWAVAQTERAVKATGLPISLYAATFSPGLGTISWSTFVPDLATLEAAGDALVADADVQKGSEGFAKHTVGGIDDGLAQVIHGEVDPNRVINYVTVVNSVCAGGQIAKAMAVGVDLAIAGEKITDHPTMFLAGVTGPYGAVSWVTGFEDIRALEQGNLALQQDPAWVEKIDKDAADVFADDPAATSQLIFRRLV